MTEAQQIFEYLVAAADEHGERAVRDAIKLFSNRRHRAAARGAKVEKRKSIPLAWTRAALKRQNYLCARCGEKIDPDTKSVAERATGDHIVPHSTGGEHASSNIAAMHGRCNSAKGNRSLYEDAKRTGMSLADRERILSGTYSS